MKKILSPIFLFLAATIFLSSCEDVVEVDLEQGLERLVVEGAITDIPNYYDTITISNNVDFYDENGINYVQGATVTISDDLGNTDNLTESLPGRYTTSTTYRGVPGRTYTLNVTTGDGATYYSDPVEMRPVPEMDSLYLMETDEYYALLGWPEVIWGDNRWQIMIDFYDNETIDDVYSWNVWKNGENMTDQGSAFPVRDDFFGRNPEGDYWKGLITFDFLDDEGNPDMLPGDSIFIEQFTMSITEFDYINTLVNSESSNAFEAFFGTTPAPVESNIHNTADPYELHIGFFGAHSVVRDYVIIPELPQE